jgi:methylase of polypeptide subunit release factors
MDAYKWLARMAAARLRPGGLCLVQCGKQYLDQVMGIFRRQRRLCYRWQLAIVFHRSIQRPGNPCLDCFWPLLLFSKGDWDKKGLTAVSDGIQTSFEKRHHDWEAPVRPFVKWISALTRPQALICDPFMGSATIGLAVKEAGQGRRFIGTEVDAATYRVARGRLANLR